MEPIVITAHAHKRFHQRFRLRFPKEATENHNATNSYILGQLSKARPVIKWKQYPFYHNSITAKHGMIDVFERSGIYYVTQLKGNKRIVKTCVDSWKCEKC